MFKPWRAAASYVLAMTESNELPIFPTTAPTVFADPVRTGELFVEVLSRLAEVVEVEADQLGLPTPCSQYTVGELRTHVLGWLEFFAAALTDPTAAGRRPDPAAFVLDAGTAAGDAVKRRAPTSPERSTPVSPVRSSPCRRPGWPATVCWPWRSAST